MAPTTIERSLVSDQVFRILCADLVSGRYEPGERLPTQRTLAADLDVNMASIREAVKRLEQLRLVESRQGEGMRVRDWRRNGGLDVLAPLMLRAGGLDRETFSAVLEARRLMLAEAASLAAVRAAPDQAQQLVALAERIAEAPDAAAAQALDFAFFSELLDAAGNVVFVLIMNSIRELYFQNAEAFRPLLAEHVALAPLYRCAAKAIAAADAARAAGAVRRIAEAQEASLLESLA